MNEEQLQAIEARRNKADIMSVTNAVHDSDECTHADYTFAEWAPDDIAALIAEVRSLRAKLDAVPVAEIRAFVGAADIPVGYWSERHVIVTWLKPVQP